LISIFFYFRSAHRNTRVLESVLEGELETEDVFNGIHLRPASHEKLKDMDMERALKDYIILLPFVKNKEQYSV
jgi:hypothetical protein